jgi:hypothetical protein
VSDDNGSELAELIAQRGREVVLERLRAAFAHQAATRAPAVDLSPALLEQLVQEAAARADGALWRRSLAEATMQQMEINLSEALAHPALERAEKLVQAPGYLPAPEPEPQPVAEEPQTLRLSAIHLNGIETLGQGDRDIELRLSDAGLDVLKRSSGAAIGRLEWREIESVELPAPRRGLRGRRRSHELHVSTGRGQAQFELPGLTDEELHEHLEPALARLAGKTSGGGNAG